MPVALVPLASFRTMDAISVRVAVHYRVAVLKSEMASAHMEADAHTAVASAAARIRIAPRVQNASDGDGNDSCNRSQQHGGPIPPGNAGP